MAETDNPDAPIMPPRAARFGEGPEGKVARRERHSGQQSALGRLGQFLHDVRNEMRRGVTWPTPTHVQNTTIITLIAVIFFAIYLFLVDMGMTYLITGLEWLVGKLAGWLGFA